MAHKGPMRTAVVGNQICGVFCEHCGHDLLDIGNFEPPPVPCVRPDHPDAFKIDYRPLNEPWRSVYDKAHGGIHVPTSTGRMV